MSALSIQPTYPIFTDIDGQPLEAGYVWIGTANLDPQTNPINVYWDAALTISAPQPIRTLAGYPSRNGTPARLYVNSDYSIRVMNRNGSTVYSAPAATERFGNILTSANLADNSVTFAKMQNIATAVILGRSTAGNGDVEALTRAQATALLLDAGLVIHVAMNTAPTGFLKANGALVSRTSYAALFAAIGTTFGAGDGSTTFALPDLRGEFIRGWDDGRGVDAGRVLGSAQSDQLKEHKHRFSQLGTGAGGNIAFSPTDFSNETEPAISTSRVSPAALGFGSETRPRNVALLACIKF